MIKTPHSRHSGSGAEKLMAGLALRTPMACLCGCGGPQNWTQPKHAPRRMLRVPGGSQGQGGVAISLLPLQRSPHPSCPFDRSDVGFLGPRFTQQKVAGGGLKLRDKS